MRAPAGRRRTAPQGIGWRATQVCRLEQTGLCYRQPRLTEGSRSRRDGDVRGPRGRSGHRGWTGERSGRGTRKSLLDALSEAIFGARTSLTPYVVAAALTEIRREASEEVRDTDATYLEGDTNCETSRWLGQCWTLSQWNLTAWGSGG